MNAAIKQGDVELDAALGAIDQWIGILKEEIRAERVSPNRHGRRIHALQMQLDEAIRDGRKIRPSDREAIVTTMTRYSALAMAHRATGSCFG
jgi:hypothetical protein